LEEEFSMMLNENSTIRRKEEQEFSTIDGEVVMLSLSKGAYFSLNEVASRIWELIEEPVRIEKLIDQLLEEYEIKPEECKKETLSCLEDFQKNGLLIVESD